MQNKNCFVVVASRPIHCEGLVSVLKSAGAEHCEAIKTLDELSSLGHLLTARPIVLIDLPELFEDLPGVVQKLRAHLPGCRIVLLTPDCTDSLIAQAVEARLEGLLDANIQCDALIKALELVTLGQTVFLTPAAFSRWKLLNTAERTPHGPEVLLSSRECEVLRALTSGQPNKVIARACGITESTVKVHVKAILRKIHVKNRTQAAIWAQQFSPEPSSSVSVETQAMRSSGPALQQFAPVGIHIRPAETQASGAAPPLHESR